MEQVVEASTVTDLPTTPALSPMRQRVAKHMFRGWLFNGYRRLSAQVVYWIIPFAGGSYALRPLPESLC